MPSMRASVDGVVKVKQAIAQQGWRVHDKRWLVAASKLLEPEGDWQINGPYAYGCSLQTWERFLQRTAIRDRSFIAFCKVLNLSPSQIAASDPLLITADGNYPNLPMPLTPEYIQHSLFGTPSAVESTIQRLHALGYAAPDEWRQVTATDEPDQARVVLTKRVDGV